MPMLAVSEMFSTIFLFKAKIGQHSKFYVLKISIPTVVDMCVCSIRVTVDIVANLKPTFFVCNCDTFVTC